MEITSFGFTQTQWEVFLVITAIVFALPQYLPYIMKKK